MKIAKIAKLCKDSMSIYIMERSDGAQFISNGYGAYLLEGMPELDERTVTGCLDIPRDKVMEYHVQVRDVPAGICWDDYIRDERTVKELDFTVGFDGKKYRIMETSAGPVLIPEDYMAPFKDLPEEDIWYKERTSAKGHVLIAVENGMNLVGMICPKAIPEIMEIEINNLSGELQLLKSAENIQNLGELIVDPYTGEVKKDGEEDG